MTSEPVKNNQQLPNQGQASPADWDACPAGEVSGMVRRVQKRWQNLQKLQWASGALLVVIAGLLIAEFSVPTTSGSGSSQNRQATISCGDLKKHADDYITGEISAELKSQIDAHLEDCPHCPEFMKQKKANRGGG